MICAQQGVSGVITLWFFQFFTLFVKYSPLWWWYSETHCSSVTGPFNTVGGVGAISGLSNVTSGYLSRLNPFSVKVDKYSLWSVCGFLNWKFNTGASESVLLGGMKSIFHKEGSTRQRSFSALCRVFLPQRIPPPSGNLIEIKLLPPGEIKNKQTTTPAAKLWSSLQLICCLPDGQLGLSDQRCILS